MKNFYLIFAVIVLIGFSVFFRKLAVDRINPYYIQIIAGGIYFLCIPLWFYLLGKEDNKSYSMQGMIFAAICIILDYLKKTQIQ